MKRWAAAFVAVLFLATATLHILAHHGESDGDCAVCQVQASSLPAAPAPQIVVVQTLETVPPPMPALQAAVVRVFVAPARAPPVLQA